MGTVQICLIIIAVIVLIGSFFVTEKLSDKEISEMKQLSSKEMERILERDLKKAKEDINETLEQCVEDSVENAREPLSKITNEKIMAINEYSDTVLEEINKNRNEITFLYSMLNDKQDEIQKMSVVIDKSKQHIKIMLEELAELTKKQTEVTKMQAEAEVAVEEINPAEEISQKLMEVQEVLENISEDMEYYSNKDVILDMYKEGKELVDIAKELNIGFGEVKLVVDLYKGEN